MSVERLRLSPPAMVQVLTQDVIRQHVDRIEPATVADLFALSELALVGALGVDLNNWAMRAAREILDMPEGAPRLSFLEEVARLPAEQVPARMRDAIQAVASIASAASLEVIESLGTAWSAVSPVSVALPAGKITAPKVGPTAKPASKAAPRAPKTPAALVDPRRAEWIREDAVTRLSNREYAERGLKESIFVAGIKHRSPFTDMTPAEILTELRRLERERKLKHTGERWTVR